MPTVQVATYQWTTFRTRNFSGPIFSSGVSTITLTPAVNAGGISTIALIYEDARFTMIASPPQLTVGYPNSYSQIHHALLQTEKPVFFEWVMDPTGVVIEAALLTGE